MVLSSSVIGGWCSRVRVEAMATGRQRTAGIIPGRSERRGRGEGRRDGESASEQCRHGIHRPRGFVMSLGSEVIVSSFVGEAPDPRHSHQKTHCQTICSLAIEIVFSNPTL